MSNIIQILKNAAAKCRVVLEKLGWLGPSYLLHMHHSPSRSIYTLNANYPQIKMPHRAHQERYELVNTAAFYITQADRRTVPLV